MGCLKLPEAPTIWLPEHESPRGDFARGIGGRMSGRRLVSAAPAASAPFNGNFATLFTTPYQSVQTDLGLTYGGTMLATGTTPPVVTLTGALIGHPVPIRMTVGVTGALGVWTWQISYDGGATIDEVGSSAAGPTALRAGGPGNGLSISIAAGNAAADNVWQATCAGLADQSGNAIHYTQATASFQPIITPGLNGFPGLLFDGVDDFLGSNLVLPAPLTTPGCTFLVARSVTWVANRRFTIPSGSGGYGIGQGGTAQPSPTLFATVSTASLFTAALPVGSFGAISGNFTGTAADSIRAGSGLTVTGSAGNVASTDMRMGSGRTNLSANCEILALVFATGAVPDAAVRAAVTSKYGASVAV